MFDSLSFKENFVNHLESNTTYQYGELNQQTLMEVIISHVSRNQIACRRLSNVRNELSRCKRIKERLRVMLCGLWNWFRYGVFSWLSWVGPGLFCGCWRCNWRTVSPNSCLLFVEVNQVLDGDQDVQRKLVRPQKDGFQSYHQTTEQTRFPILCGWGAMVQLKSLES